MTRAMEEELYALAAQAHPLTPRARGECVRAATTLVQEIVQD